MGVVEISQWGDKTMKFHFSLSKLRKQPFFAENVIRKCQISKSRGQDLPCPPPSDAHTRKHTLCKISFFCQQREYKAMKNKTNKTTSFRNWNGQSLFFYAYNLFKKISKGIPQLVKTRKFDANFSHLGVDPLTLFAWHDFFPVTNDTFANKWNVVWPLFRTLQHEKILFE